LQKRNKTVSRGCRYFAAQKRAIYVDFAGVIAKRSASLLLRRNGVFSFRL
jgi:hypothetical protein